MTARPAGAPGCGHRAEDQLTVDEVVLVLVRLARSGPTTTSTSAVPIELTGAEVVYGHHRGGREDQGLGHRLGGRLLAGHVVDVGDRHPGGGVDRGQHVPTRRLELGGDRPGGPGHSRGVGRQHRDVGGRGGGGRGREPAGRWWWWTPPERAPVPDVEVVGWMTPRTSTVVTTKATSTMAAFTTGHPEPPPPGAAVGPCRSVGGLGHYVPACQPGGSEARVSDPGPP